MTRSIYTTVTPLPAGISRSIVRECLHDHYLMIDLNPLVIKRDKMTKPYNKSTPEEFNCTWYEITDRISYFPGVKGQVTYYGAFHDLENGLQTHIYAPMGLDIKEKWTVGGNEPGEPRETPELGINAPNDGLYLREDIDLSVNMTMVRFVKKNLVNAHKQLVDRMVARTKHIDNAIYNANLQRPVSQAYTESNYSVSSTSGNRISTAGPSSGPSSQGYTSPTQVYDERYGSQGQGWHDASTGLHPRYHANPAPPYDHRLSQASDQKYNYRAPTPPHPALRQSRQEQEGDSGPQELPTEQRVAELE